MTATVLDTLRELAHDLWWSWDAEATALWEAIDPLRWARYHHNPVAVLHHMEPARRAELEADEAFCARVAAVAARRAAYCAAPGLCAEELPELQGDPVAYFSMEFGLHESLRLYSGGLGVLAGDHLRSASDLGVAMVGVSLLYREGYFRQVIDQDRQLATFPHADYELLPVRPCTHEDGSVRTVSIPVANRTVTARLWRLQVGRCSLILLDTDHDANGSADRMLTRQLYGGDDRMRASQELLLGIGGVRALDALGITPAVYHLNEGHCAFVPVELVARGLYAGQSLAEALASVRARCVFTTHTPVPAGHDRFDWGLVDELVGPYRNELGLSRGTLMELGREHPGTADERLCMTVLALRTTSAANGVSELHGAVSRAMWQDMFPGTDEGDVPIGHVTNGVHPIFWTADETRALFDVHLPAWRERTWDEAAWAGARELPDAELWALRRVLRGHLVAEVARRTDRTLDPDALTIGFARRLALYKRGDLLFADLERLVRILEQGPAQLVFAGKAHPQDLAGQEILTRVLRWSDRADLVSRVVVLEDYDIALGRLLTSGCDLWLNNPRRPQEASGTSGQKVVLNAGLNLSVLDGWWPEGFDGTNGFAIGAGRTWAAQDTAEHDAFDAASLYEVLEQEVLPAWRDRDARGLPLGWLDRVRRSLETCAPRFNAHRMVRDYALQAYAPRVQM